MMCEMYGRENERRALTAAIMLVNVGDFYVVVFSVFLDSDIR